MSIKDKIIIVTYLEMQDTFHDAVTADDIVIYDKYRDVFFQTL